MATGLDDSQGIDAVIGVPAPVDAEGGVVGRTTRLPGREGSRPRRHSRRRPGFPSLSRTMPISLRWRRLWPGAAEGARHLLYIEASTWIGVGLVIDGRLYTAAAEVPARSPT